MTDEQVKLTEELDKQRRDIVRAIRKMADMFADEMNGPQAKALGWVYGAAASLIDSVNWTHFAEVARATIPDDKEPQP